ncbi:MAG: sugar transferase [Armatimonadota bacterium]|nr:MAG: sugar transferase [Armatimonadota bacterium]
MQYRLDDILKRAADIVLAAVALALSVPFWLWAMMVIGLGDGWPFLYAQTRVGRQGRVFRIYKFRSMIKHAEKHTGPVFSPKNDRRVTPVGRIMRKTAIDEIPQLINIFKGDMSWVGPRPARPEEVAQYRREVPRYDLRHQVRPGLTGMAQVYGGDYSDIGRKLAYDLQYIRQRSLLLDLRLFVRSWLNTLLGGWERARAGAQSDFGSGPMSGG